MTKAVIVLAFYALSSGIELRNGAFACAEDTTIMDSGLQAIVAHAGAQGFTLIR